MAKEKATAKQSQKTTRKPKESSKTKATQTTKNLSKKVGIVIPVYNTPVEFYKECLKNVVEQSYKDLEIVLVHDGDHEPCVEVSLEYAKKDSRITVIVKPFNEGAAIARNIGIDYFSGVYEIQKSSTENGLTLYGINNDNPYQIGVIYKKQETILNQEFLIPSSIDYIYFLDSDDNCKLDLVDKCLQKANGVDVVWFNFDKIIEDSANGLDVHIKNLDIVQTTRKITKEDWLQHAKDTECVNVIFVWQVFIDFKFLQNIKLRFINQIMREDNLFGVLLLLQCRNIFLLAENLINYRIRIDGETNAVISSENVFLPGFLRPLFEAFGGDLVLTKRLYVSLSWFIQKLYFADFVKDRLNEPNIEAVIGGMSNRFARESLGFIHASFKLNTDYYFNICFNIYLSYIEELPNHSPYYRPFDKIADYLGAISQKRGEKIRLLKEILFLENNIIVEKNNFIEQLLKRVETLEAENKRLSDHRNKKLKNKRVRYGKY